MQRLLLVSILSLGACGGAQQSVGGHLVSTYSCEPEQIFPVLREEVEKRFAPLDQVAPATFSLALVHWHNEYGRRIKEKSTEIRPGFVSVEIAAKVRPTEGKAWMLEIRETSNGVVTGSPAGTPIPPGHAGRPAWLDQRMQSLRDAIYQRLAHCSL